MLTPGESLPKMLHQHRHRRSRIRSKPSVAMMAIRTLLLVYLYSAISTSTSTSSVGLVTALSLSSVSVQMNKNSAKSANGMKQQHQQVQWLGTRVSQKTDQSEYEEEGDFDDEIVGYGQSQGQSYKGQTGQATQELQRIQKKQTESPFKERQVWQALANLEKDSTYIYCICFAFIFW
jgi:hypothetical protein